MTTRSSGRIFASYSLIHCAMMRFDSVESRFQVFAFHHSWYEECVYNLADEEYSTGQQPDHAGNRLAQIEAVKPAYQEKSGTP